MIVRTYGIHPKYKLKEDPYLRTESNDNSENNISRPIREYDRDGKFLYTFEFSTSFSMDEKKEIKIDFLDRDLTGRMFEVLVSEFAQQLALKMQYKNDDITSKYGVPHNFVNAVLNYK